MRFPAPVAAVLAKTGSLSDLNPRLFNTILMISGAMLVYEGCRRPAKAPADRPALS
jgi:predicted DNA repair protein MutK